MKKVYVAGAISADSIEQGLRNIQKGISMGASLMKVGYSPYVPHLDYQYNLVHPKANIDVEMYYKHDLDWLSLCDCVLVLEGWENSKGVAKELQFAKENKIPIYFSVTELFEREPIETCIKSGHRFVL